MHFNCQGLGKFRQTADCPARVQSPQQFPEKALVMPDWRPAARLETLRLRAERMQQVRRFFQQRGLLEVETPMLSAAAGTDPNLDSLHSRYQGPGAPETGELYLHTSPEFPMKRLLAAGAGPIWQCCKVFRGGERGRRHNPEFTMLEWYRPGWDHHRLMTEVADLVSAVCGERPVVTRTYGELFRPLGVNAHTDDIDQLTAAAERLGIPLPHGLHRDALLDLMLSERIAPELGRGSIEFVHDFPASQAALARIRPDTPPLAERFECFVDGMEIANGFHELNDAAEQRSRFQADSEQRRLEGKPVPPMDERLLEALAASMPDCAGVAVGLDRLFMVALGCGRIDEVLAFPIERA